MAHGGPPLSGRLRAEPADFEVEEILGFEPSGQGEHAFLWIEKTGANTEWVARQLADAAGVAPMAVGFCRAQGPPRGDAAGVHRADAGPCRSGLDCARDRWRPCAFGHAARSQAQARRTPRQPFSAFACASCLAITPWPNSASMRSARAACRTISASNASAATGKTSRSPRPCSPAGACRAISAASRCRPPAPKCSTRCWRPRPARRLERRIGGRSLDARRVARDLWTGSVNDELARRLAELDIHPDRPLWGAGELRSTAEVRALERLGRRAVGDADERSRACRLEPGAPRAAPADRRACSRMVLRQRADARFPARRRFLRDDDVAGIVRLAGCGGRIRPSARLRRPSRCCGRAGAPIVALRPMRSSRRSAS